MEIKVDYSQKPSLLDLEILKHPDRTDTITIDTNDLEAIKTLKDGEEYVQGEENLKRLKRTKKTLLDARILEELLKHPEAIPESWKKKADSWITWIHFPGTVLLSPDGYRYVLYLYWNNGKWHWNYRWLEDGWLASNLSAVLASSALSPLTSEPKPSDPLNLDGEIITIGGEKYKLKKIE